MGLADCNDHSPLFLVGFVALSACFLGSVWRSPFLLELLPPAAVAAGKIASFAAHL